jgi:hypothetical protein
MVVGRADTQRNVEQYYSGPAVPVGLKKGTREGGARKSAIFPFLMTNLVISWWLPVLLRHVTVLVRSPARTPVPDTDGVRGTVRGEENELTIIIRFVAVALTTK